MLSAHVKRNLIDEPRCKVEPRPDRVQAAILAGGMGTRLRSLVADRPKPMAKVGEKPFLELQLECLKKHGVRRFVFCVGYMWEQIHQYFGDGRKWGVEIEYSVERELLGTAGALKQALPHTDGTFLALNGDSYLDVDVQKLVQFHEQRQGFDRGAVGTIVLTEAEDARQFGSVRMDTADRIVSFVEKSESAATSKLISAGIYVFQPEILQWIPAGKKLSLERDLFPALLKAGFGLFGYPAEGFFVDIGTPQGYRRLQEYVEEARG